MYGVFVERSSSAVECWALMYERRQSKSLTMQKSETTKAVTFTAANLLCMYQTCSSDNDV